MQIAVLLQSARLDRRDVDFLVAAVNLQLREAADIWSKPPVPVAFYETDVGLPPETTHVLGITDTVDVPGALGYHTDFGGIVYGQVLAQDVPGTGITLSHECLEMLVDPTASEWRGKYALEIADAVEGDCYQVNATVLGETRSVLVSNYVTPAWFEAGSSGPWDKMGRLLGPLSMSPGGYLIVRDDHGNVTNVFARADRVPASFVRKLGNPRSRTLLRLCGKAA